MYTLSKFISKIICSLALVNTFTSSAYSQSLGLEPVPIPTTEPKTATRGECLAVIPLLPPAPKISPTRSLQPFVWVYIIPPVDRDTLVVLSHRNTDNITVDSKPERVIANKPSFIRFSLPILNQASQKNQLEPNQKYAFKIQCFGPGSSPTVAVQHESNDLKLSNLSFEQRMFEFAKLNLWAETIDSLFDERFICSNRVKGAALFANLVKNELLVEKFFGESTKPIEIEKVMIKDFDEFHNSRCIKTR